MGAFGGLVMTNRGLALQAKAQAGAELRYTRVAIGDGYLGGQSIATLNNLINERMSLDITKLKVLGQGRAVIGTVLTNQGITTGFYFREIGIFATDPDEGEVLYAYANAGSNAEYIPPGGGPDVVEKHIDSVVVVGQAPNVTAVIDQSLVFATLKDMNDHRTAEVLDHPDGSVTAAKLAAGSVTDEKIGDRTISDTSAPSGNSGTLTAILGWLANMIKSITGKSNWRTPPATTLEAAKAHMDATTGVHGATSAATPNTIVQRDANGRFKAAAPSDPDDVARKAEVDERAPLSGAVFTGPVEYRSNPRESNDLNNEINPGWVVFTSNTANRPDISGFSNYGVVRIERRTSNRVAQTAYGLTGNMNAQIAIRVLGNDGWSQWYKVWNESNDGAGSGLDADMLDGMQPSTSASANTIAQRDSSGRLKAAAPSASDDVARKAEVDAAMAAAQAAQNTANAALPASQYTASDILTKLKTVDGAGSGLDADLLDGIQAERFIYGDNNSGSILFGGNDVNDISKSGFYHTTGTPANLPPGISNGFILHMQHPTSNTNILQIGQGGSNRMFFRRMVNGSWDNWFEFWHSGNIPYETGTWTPELQFTRSSSGIAYSLRTGRYTRIGNVVYFTFRIALTSKGSADGDAYITGLPFTSMSGNEHAAFAIGMFSGITMPANAYWIYGIIFNSSNQIRIRPSGDLDGAISLNASNFRDNTDIRGEGFYFIS